MLSTQDVGNLIEAEVDPGAKRYQSTCISSKYDLIVDLPSSDEHRSNGQADDAVDERCQIPWIIPTSNSLGISYDVENAANSYDNSESQPAAFSDVRRSKSN